MLTVVLLLLKGSTESQLSLILTTVAAVAAVGVAIWAALPVASPGKGRREPSTSEVPPTMSGTQEGPLPPRVGTGPVLALPQVEFIGRQAKLAGLLNDLRDPQKPLIAIVGIGGIGKTALAEEAVRRLATEEFFTWTVWRSTQAERFTGEKVERVEASDYTFDALLSDILSQCGMVSNAGAPTAIKVEAVKRLLSTSHVLVVLDNLETVADRDALVGSLFEILGKGKILVTSRYEIHHQKVISIHLGGLSQEDGIAFLRSLAERQNNRNLRAASQSTLIRIHKVTGGAPLAMMLIAGQMSYQPIGLVLGTIEKAGANELSYEFYSFIFKKSWNELNDRCRRVLVAMRHFEGSPIADAVRYTVDMDEATFYSAATVLVQRSLLSVVVSAKDARYSLHPLTRYFINADIAAGWDQR